MKHPLLFASDLHGNRYAYDALFSLAEQRGIEAVVLGGDLTPKWPILIFGMRGPVIPCAPHLQPQTDSQRYTYVDFLKRAQDAVGKRTRPQQIRHWINMGGYEVRLQEETLDWKDLLAEQAIMRRIIEGFDTQNGGFSISHDEWERLRPILSVAFKRSKLETSLDQFLAALRFRTLPHEELIEGHRAISEVSRALRAAEGLPTVRQFFDTFRYLLLPYLAGDAVTSLSPTVSLVQAAATMHVLHSAIDRMDDLKSAERHQVKFLRNYLATRIRAYRNRVPGGRVYFILGNDDVVPCDAVARSMHTLGLATYLPLGSVDLAPGIKIAGYPYVPEADGFYDGWQKPEREIVTDLRRLEAASKGTPTIYAVHCPPSHTSLDLGWGHGHYGSSGVRDWLRDGTKGAVLSGHIHEAPFLNGGVWRESVNGTPCFQPGGWHDEGVCAVLLDAADPSSAEWIHDPAKIRREESS